MRIGFGYDSHRLVPGRRFVLGGVEIPFEKGPEGHSDADALIHAIIDAMLGALGAGDIGAHFPDTDPVWKGISSLVLLEKTLLLARQKGFFVAQVDSTVIAQAPRLAPYIEAIRAALGKALRTGGENVSVKAKTNEGMGFTGMGEGIAAFAVCLLMEIEQRETPSPNPLP
ncbi:MAG: 2-C-methyl-D-erythritol 2,4-cyclodiphosphate synthase [Nitrospiraceae bacterium]|nr:2-C-methyl-D-erythritol 2,4-cyclodiphosphate synthase [Nitrospiraceae bacterium]